MPDRNRTTLKKYYTDQHLKSLDATIIQVKDGTIELDQTIAFPESGGQESDTGTILTEYGSFRFTMTKSLYGSPILLEGFNGGKSGGIILHVIHEEDLHGLTTLKPGMSAKILIDAARREHLTISHSASHFLYAAALQERPGLKGNTLGCHIKEEGARFDFFSTDPFSRDEILSIQNAANSLIAKNMAIKMESHPENPDARTWVYGEIRIPCGGTHLASPEAIGPIQVGRKNIGKNKERLICTFPNARADTTHYHDTSYKQVPPVQRRGSPHG